MSMWMWVFVYPLTTVDAVIVTFSVQRVCVTMAHDCWLLYAKRLQLLSIQSDWLHSVRCGAKTKKKKKKRKTNHQWDIQKRDEKVCTQNMSAIGIGLRVAFSHTVTAHRAFGKFVCHQTRSPCRLLFAALLCTHDCQFACSPLLTTTYISFCQSTNWKNWNGGPSAPSTTVFNSSILQCCESQIIPIDVSAAHGEHIISDHHWKFGWQLYRDSDSNSRDTDSMVHRQQSIFPPISTVYFSPQKSIEFGLCAAERFRTTHETCWTFHVFIRKTKLSTKKPHNRQLVWYSCSQCQIK